MGKWNPDDAGDTIVTTKISSKKLNVLLFIFNFFFVSLGIVFSTKELNFMRSKNEGDVSEIWNGYTHAPCWVSYIYIKY